MKYRNVLRAWAISAISQSFAREMLISGEYDHTRRDITVFEDNVVGVF